MNDGLIPKRYAKAIYEVAVEKDCASQMYDLMKGLSATFCSEPALQDTLSNPYIASKDKIALIVTATKGSGVPEAFIADVLNLLVRNDRIDMIRDIADAYVRLYRDINHIYEVKVVSAAPMTASESERLLALIKSHLKVGTMEVSSGVDPSLIGGFCVTVGNERIDASISNELKQLRLNLIKK